MILINLVIIAACIGLNAFFVAVEYAIVASRRSRLETISDGESKSLQLVRSWLDQPNARDRLIAANQVAITLINLAVGALSENTFTLIFAPLFSKIQLSPPFEFLESAISALPIILGLVIATGLQVVFGELVPKVAVLRARKSLHCSQPAGSMFLPEYSGILFHCWNGLRAVYCECWASIPKARIRLRCHWMK